jgi:hypothetical protein
MGLLCFRRSSRSLQVTPDIDNQHVALVFRISDYRKIRISRIAGALGGGLMGGFFNQVVVAAARKEMEIDSMRKIEIITATAFLSLIMAYMISLASYKILSRA